MSKLTESARGEGCCVRVPGHCNSSSETTVLAHISGVRFGHGTGQKANDMLGAYACSDCHDVIDGRQRSNYTSRELKLMHYEGCFETQLKMKAKGLL